MLRLVTIAVTVLALAGLSAAQSVQISPSELGQVPSSSATPYWQQLVITFDQADIASDSTVTINMPLTLLIYDVNGDGSVQDDIRLMYQPVGAETPGFFVSSESATGRAVIGSVQDAAFGGRLYVQLPILIFSPEPGSILRYGAIEFDDPRERDLVEGPFLTVLSNEEFALLGSMDIAKFAPLFAVTGADTTTSTLGTIFPDEAIEVLAVLPDLVFDGGGLNSSDLLGFGNGDDSDDTEYSFYFSTDGSLRHVDSSVATAAQASTGEVYRLTEGDTGATVQFLTQVLDADTYYLYVTSNVTGGIPLARSRAITVRHQPQVLLAEPGLDLTLDTGDLYDLSGDPSGNSVQEVMMSYAALDHDDSVFVHLFYSEQADLTSSDVDAIGDRQAQLAGATPITAEGQTEPEGSLSWHILEPTPVPAGDYWVYTVGVGGSEVGLKRSDGQVHVRHAPSLRLDALDDAVRSGANTITTGGTRPQPFITFTWGRGGSDGDDDFDGDAEIALYYSSREAAAEDGEEETFWIPGGAEALLADVDVNTHLIVAGLTEDPDLREDNQFAWDLTNLTDTTVPEAGRTYYVYGIISDGDDERLVQMNGGRLNDAASRIVFEHPPTVRPLQPVSDMAVAIGRSGRVSWQDTDLDTQAWIRIILTQVDHGEFSDYATVTSAPSAYVANSSDGRAGPEVDAEFDLDENSDADLFDVKTDQLQLGINADDPLGPGSYQVYIAITESQMFSALSPAWRCAGLMEIVEAGVEGGGSEEAVFNLAPQIFTLGTNARQLVDVRVDDADEAVDLVVVHLEIDGTRMSVTDMDAETAGIQPFAVSPGFSPSNLVMNTLTDGNDGELFLAFEYFEATTARIAGLDGVTSLASFELVALDNEGDTDVDLVSDPLLDRLSRLDRDGVAVSPGSEASLATVRIVPGRALVRGTLRLEGRDSMIDSVDFSLRPWASYEVVDDEVFSAANDIDPIRNGVQVQIAADGAFELMEVPTGRLDIYAHVDGYLDAWHPGLDLLPAQVVDDIRPVTPSGVAADDSLMLGGDVAGYTDLSGRSLPDNEVTLADWDFTAALFDRTADSVGDSARADITGDGSINVRDLALVGANFLRRGPRPVYKVVPRSESSVPALLRTEYRSRVDGEAVLELWGDRISAAAAYQFDLAFSPGAWKIQEVVPGARGAMVVQKQEADGHKVAAVLMDEGPAGVPLMSWRLQALQAEPSPPVLAGVLILNRSHREIVAEVSTPSGPTQRQPHHFALSQNYPNPFNPETTITFTVPELASGVIGSGPHVQLEVYNSVGQLVAELVDGASGPGPQTVRWDGRDTNGVSAGSGVYFYRLRIVSDDANSRTQVRRMLLLR
jgi:hypothetical protein